MREKEGGEKKGGGGGMGKAGEGWMEQGGGKGVSWREGVEGRMDGEGREGGVYERWSGWMEGRKEER